ncbi:hypothetical protein [Terriglobus saanensis]|uniref:ABC transporter related protein n=1 Tax=Terriglobus saanensis (strain ATCC BAA-1853 / DSM 23119 / SP1PR4) TaxID=401053 RepID=E8UZ11_TERSS|nr:hypothetical protein [Terriglobus saanensis]ADV80956.1 ABC transporter related protein [Terriglobus saanensis SP1PR4]
MKYQVVLQFATAGMSQFGELVALEEGLIQNLPPPSEVDGHDFGSGEFNIFILTDQPRETFDAARKLIEKGFFQSQLRAAYRERGKGEYVILWPEHLEEFRVA